MQTQMQDGRDHYGPGRCGECGCALMQTERATRHSPAAFDCPCCDGGLTFAEIEAMRRVESWGPEERD